MLETFSNIYTSISKVSERGSHLILVSQSSFLLDTACWSSLNIKRFPRVILKFYRIYYISSIIEMLRSVRLRCVCPNANIYPK